MPEPSSFEPRRDAASPFPFPGWPADGQQMWQPMMAGLLAWNGAVGKATAECGRECAEFAGRRMRADAALVRQLADCHDAGVAWQVYLSFWQRAAADYQAEFARLARLNTDAIQDGVAGVQRALGETAASLGGGKGH